MAEPIYSGDPNQPKIALTFDDGPHPNYTSELLAILSKYSVRATFFCLGENVNEHPDIARQVVNEGHLIANHSDTHPSLPKLDKNDDVLKQLHDTNTRIQNVTGKSPEYFRPPYGETDNRINDLAGSLGLTPILWSVDTNDWRGLGVDAIVNTLISVLNGSIILCHDGVEKSDQTLQAVDIAIPQLQGRGLNFVTVSELLADGINLQRDKPTITIPHLSIPPIAQPVPGQKYGVQHDDYLSKIAEKAYGDGSEQSWKKIYEANRDVIGPDPSKLVPGMVIFIPQ
jgi:peptidoglycan/xylan/chitin deacetylase (PgdA/CDA1 family)